MGKIAIVTDSNSGITQDEGRELGVSVLPMPFYINDVMYLEGITLSQEAFEKRRDDFHFSAKSGRGMWIMGQSSERI